MQLEVTLDKQVLKISSHSPPGLALEDVPSFDCAFDV
jgi:hypothetical protein